MYSLTYCELLIPVGSSIVNPTRHIFISIPFPIESTIQSQPEKSIDFNKIAVFHLTKTTYFRAFQLSQAPIFPLFSRYNHITVSTPIETALESYCES